MTVPIATYRLQLRDGMTFRRAESLVPYLRRLGASHLYVSPVFAATTGSTHGYDIVDPNRFDPALGSEADFMALSDALKAAGMGLVLDIVPNHMAASLENPWWRSVVTYGRASPHAGVFDIDWSRRLTLPWLSKPFAKAAEDGEVGLTTNPDGTAAFSLSGMSIPLHPDSVPPDPAAGKVDAEALEALHERQNFELIPWRDAPKRLSYRRFFEVADLVGVNVENAEVFEKTHRLILDLVRSGRVDGLRVDHVDGLTDPAAYLARLRQAIGPDVWLLVEKILQDGEELPSGWPVSGTTGYEFIDGLTHLLVDRKGAERLRRNYAALGGATDHRGGLRDARSMLITGNFEGEVAALRHLAVQLALSHEEDLGVSEADIDQALHALLAEFPVYRTYGTAEGMPEPDLALLQGLCERLRKTMPETGGRALGFLLDLLTDNCPPRQTAKAALFRRRFQQLTGPLMAKALEDTLFYRQMPVLGLNEVGGDAGREDFAPRHFHEAMTARARDWPLALSSTATHDTKRGEDARARLYALTDDPQPWIEGVTRWRAGNSRHVTRGEGGPAPEPELEWALYQALFGVWPPFLDPDDDEGIEALFARLLPYAEKALREAKLRSNWTDADEAYEGAVKDYIAALLSADNRLFLRDFHRSIQPYLRAGAWNGIAQTLVKLTAPGIPDIYQGSERLDLSLVDPDNRRPPDFKGLQASLVTDGDWPLDEEALLSGRLKQALVARVLAFRRANAALFEKADYAPVAARGGMKTHVIAFRRNHAGRSLIVVAPRMPLALIAGDGAIASAGWADTAIDLPDIAGPLTDALTGRMVAAEPHLRLSGVLDALPVALLLSG